MGMDYKITGIDGLGKGRALLRMTAEKSGLRKLSKHSQANRILEKKKVKGNAVNYSLKASFWANCFLTSRQALSIASTVCFYEVQKYVFKRPVNKVPIDLNSSVICFSVCHQHW